MLVIKKNELDTIFDEMHSSMHAGRDKTYQMIKDRYWFKGMYQWIAEKIKYCFACKEKRKHLPPATVEPLHPIPVQAKNMARIHLDLSSGIYDVTLT